MYAKDSPEFIRKKNWYMHHGIMTRDFEWKRVAYVLYCRQYVVVSKNQGLCSGKE